MISMTVDGDYNEYDLKLSEWRGYVVRALEDINKELQEIKCDQKFIDEKIDGVNSKLTGMQLKVAAIGGTTGLIVSLLLFVLTGM